MKVKNRASKKANISEYKWLSEKGEFQGNRGVLQGWPDFLHLLRKCSFYWVFILFIFLKKLLEVVEGGSFKNLWSLKLPLAEWEVSHTCTQANKIIEYFPKREGIFQGRMKKKTTLFLMVPIETCKQTWKPVLGEICWMYILESVDWWLLISLI